jgi:glycerol-3-phosphate cytidylyltransferase-like family protein
LHKKVVVGAEVITTSRMEKSTLDSKSNQRRKSIAAVKFVDDTKPKRPYKRRKSVAIVNPSKIVEETYHMVMEILACCLYSY